MAGLWSPLIFIPLSHYLKGTPPSEVGDKDNKLLKANF
jgi:hypothetical protein